MPYTIHDKKVSFFFSFLFFKQKMQKHIGWSVFEIDRKEGKEVTG